VTSRTVWLLMEVRANGDEVLAVDVSKEAVLRLLGREKGVVVSDRDVFEAGGSWKVRISPTLYTLRKVSVGEWLA
jgi:hypothetical protein